MTEACIVGWAHSPFGRLEDPDIESLIGRVAGAAIEDAGVAATDIDATFVSLFNNGFSGRTFPPRWCCSTSPTCASSRSRGSRMPARPAPPPCMARATSSAPAAAASPW